MDIHDILVAAGITVLDARVAPRPGSFAPIGIVLHHTGNPQHGDLPSLHLLQTGRSDLAGPLVQLGAGREGTIASVTDGRANHAGKGSDVVAAKVRADAPPGQPGPDNTDGNTLYIGIEIENAGDGHDPYTQRQLDHVVDTCVALCQHFGWTANRVIGHKEWTRRKPDPTLDMNAMRSTIAAAMIPQPQPIPEAMLEMGFLIINDNNDQTQDQYYFWPSMGDKGRKAIIPDGAALDHARTVKGYDGDIKMDRPDLDAIPTLR